MTSSPRFNRGSVGKDMKKIIVSKDYIKNESKISIKDLREKLLQKSPYCYWCGEKVKSYPEFYNRLKHPKGFKAPDNMATIDHLYSRWEPEKRYKVYPNGENKVLACFKCNQKRCKKENKKYKIKNYRISLQEANLLTQGKPIKVGGEMKMTKSKLPEDWEKELEKIKFKLLDKVEDYFPKIKPEGINKGRGEACVIVGIALGEFEKLLKCQFQKAKKDILIDSLDSLLQETEREERKK